MLVKIEFYNAPDGQVCVKPADGGMYVLDENQKEIIQEMLLEIQEFWPEAFKRLSDLYSVSSLNRTGSSGHCYIHLDSLFILTLLEKRIKCKKSSLKKAK